MQTPPQAPLKVGDKLESKAEKLRQILEKIKADGVPEHAIEIIHAALFYEPSKPIPIPDGVLVIKPYHQRINILP